MLNFKTHLNDSETNTSTLHIEIASGKVWPAKKGDEDIHTQHWTSGHGLEMIKIGPLHVARICCKPSIRPLQQPLESSQQSLTSSWTGPLGRPATRRPLQQVEAIKQNHRSQVGKIRILEKVCCLLSPAVTICAMVHGQKMAQSHFVKERKKETFVWDQAHYLQNTHECVSCLWRLQGFVVVLADQANSPLSSVS